MLFKRRTETRASRALQIMEWSHHLFGRSPANHYRSRAVWHVLGLRFHGQIVVIISGKREGDRGMGQGREYASYVASISKGR